MPIYQSQFGSGLMPLEEGLTALMKGFGARAHPEAFATRQTKRRDVGKYILPTGDIDPDAPGPVKRMLQDMISRGELWTHPDKPWEFKLSENPIEGWTQFTGQRASELWGAPETPQAPEDFGRIIAEAILGNYGKRQLGVTQPPWMQEPQQPQYGPTRERAAQQQETAGAPLENLVEVLRNRNNPQQFAYEQGGEINRETNPLMALVNMIKSDRDSVPIVAHDGEYVLSEGAVNMIGEDKLNALNELGKQFKGAERMRVGGAVTDEDKERQKQEKRDSMRYRSKNNTAVDPNAQPEAHGEEKTIKDVFAAVGEALLGGLMNAQPSEVTSVTDRKHTQPDVVESIGQEILRGAQSRGSIAGANVPSVGQQYGRAPTQHPTSEWGEVPDFSRAHEVAEQERAERNQRLDEKRHNLTKKRAVTDSGPVPWRDYGDNRTWGGGALGVGDVFHKEAPVPPEGSKAQPSDFTGTNLGSQEQPAPQEKEKEQQKGGGQKKEEEPTGTTKATPTPTPQTVGDIPEVYASLPGSAYSVDWQMISKMDPAQAMSHLQRVANAQGDTRGVQFGTEKDQSMRRFQDLMGQYSALVGISDKVNEAKWNKLTRERNAEKLKYEIDRLAAMSPYFGRLAEVELDYKDAMTRRLAAQAAKDEEVANNGLAALMDPSKLMTMMNNAEAAKTKIINDLQNAAKSSFDYAKHKKKEGLWKDFHEKKLLTDMVTGAVDIATPYEELNIGEGPKNRWFRERPDYSDTLSPEEVDRVRMRARELKNKLSQFDQIIQQTTGVQYGSMPTGTFVDLWNMLYGDNGQ